MNFSTLKRSNRLAAVVLVAFGTTACPAEETDEPADAGPAAVADAGPASNTIADIASSDENFSTLLAVVQKADLVSVLAGDGPLTVFAPTNEAFTASGLDQAALDALSAEQAAQIITYHAVAGSVLSSSLSAGVVNTVAELSLVVGTEGGVTLNGGNAVAGGANVSTADVTADNGVVHVIDRVLLPPTVADLARYAGLTELGAAVAAAGLTDTLSGDGPFTVFAPTNEAFPDETDGLDVTQILTYHVLSGAVTSGEVTSGNVDTLATQSFGEGDAAVSVNLDLFIDTSAGVRLNNTANVVIADVRGTNGVVHVIDGVLLPLNIAQVATVGGFTQLVAAVGASAPIPAGLVGNENDVPVLDAISTLSALTVFAPTDDAFGTAFPGGLPSDNAAILGVLGGHVLAGATPVLASGLPADTNAEVSALIGGLTFDAGANPPTVSLVGGNSAGIVLTDVGATNGVVHVIDAVLVPNP
ncbi:MAG: fasciclin domain-containing protein [Myxococcota bacterium]|nr:fasciclin domain-containing protein [Myxococcota bacterium]